MFISITLFGRYQIVCDGRPCTDVASAKARELLAYLLLHRERAHPREKIAGVLWGRVRKSSSMAYLRKALWSLRKVVEQEGAPPLITTDRDWVGINDQADFWLDVHVFERAFETLRDTPLGEMDPGEIEELRKSVRLYTGDLLENWYYDWCLSERDRFRDFLLIILDKLARVSEVNGSYETGIGYGRRALSVDRARESAHRQLMRLRYLSGDRTGALRQYEECVRALKQELSVEPSAATDRLHQAIRQDDALESAGTSSKGSGSLPARPITPVSTAQGLREIRRTLFSLQAQIQREMELPSGERPPGNLESSG